MTDEEPIDPIRVGLGMRLKAAREGANMSQKQVAERFDINKGTVSAWETGRGDPGVYRLRELSKLYDVASDALIWEDSLSPDAMKLAAEFDGLTEKQKTTLRALWLAFVQASSDDRAVEVAMPITRIGSTKMLALEDKTDFKDAPPMKSGTDQQT